MVKLTLVRHGETEENVSGILQGRMPGTLTEKGWRQIAALRDTLAAQPTPLDLMLTSPLLRAVQTANALNASLHLPLQEAPLLQERDWGELTGARGRGACLEGDAWQRGNGWRHVPSRPCLSEAGVGGVRREMRAGRHARPLCALPAGRLLWCHHSRNPADGKHRDTPAGDYARRPRIGAVWGIGRRGLRQIMPRPPDVVPVRGGHRAASFGEAAWEVFSTT